MSLRYRAHRFCKVIRALLSQHGLKHSIWKQDMCTARACTQHTGVICWQPCMDRTYRCHIGVKHSCMDMTCWLPVVVTRTRNPPGSPATNYLHSVLTTY